MTVNYNHTGTDFNYGAAVSFQSFGNDTAASEINQDPTIVYRPALAVIRNPGNAYMDIPSRLVVNRAFRYSSDPFDADTADGSLAYEWKKNAVTFAAHSTEQNPAFDDSFAAAGTNTVDLKVVESYSPNTAFGSPYTNFTQSSTDRLTLSVVDPEYILYPAHRNLPYTDGSPPAIDGVVTADFDDTSIGSTALGDTGWNQAHLVAYQDGTLPHVLVQSLRHQSLQYLYYSFEVRNDSLLDQYDALVMCFSPDNSAATRTDDFMLAVYPFASGAPGAGENLVPAQVRLRQWNAGASAWEWTTLAYDAGTQTFGGKNIQAKVKNFGAGGAWNLEVRVPTAAATGGTGWPTVSDRFLFSFVVFRSETAGAVSEFKWPRTSEDVFGDVETYDYNPAVWGIGEKGSLALTDYNGLSFTASSILVTPTIDGAAGAAGTTVTLPDCADGIDTNDSVLNTFEMTLLNNAVLNGAYVGLRNIKIAFRLAKWGIPGAASWITIPSYLDSPVVANPLTGVTIGAGDAAAAMSKRVTLPWTIACGESTPALDDPDDVWVLANYPGTHHCVYVEVLEAAIDGVATPQAANVLVSKMYRNFNFVTASEHRERAVIGTKGNAAPKDGGSGYRFRINVVKHAWATRRTDPAGPGVTRRPSAIRPFGGPADNNPNGSDTNSYLYWSASGYVFTGRTVVLRNAPLELVDPAGSFGMVAEHKAEVMAWEDGIVGAEEVAPDAYEMTVPLDAEKPVEVFVRPIEPTPFSLSLHAGAVTPAGNFNGGYTTGFCVILDAQYRITQALSIIFMAGYNYLPGAPGYADTSIVNLSLGPRVTLPVSQTIFAYAQAGVNAYVQDFDFSTWYYGGSVGAGAGLVLSPRFSLELGADVHYTSAQAWLIQSHLGISLRL